jgi:hypothetical protein
MITRLKSSCYNFKLLRRSCSVFENESESIKNNIEKIRMNVISQMNKEKFSYIVSKHNFSSFGFPHKEILYELDNAEVYYLF